MELTRILIMGSLCLTLMFIGLAITIYDFKLMGDHPEDYCDEDDHRKSV